MLILGIESSCDETSAAVVEMNDPCVLKSDMSDTESSPSGGYACSSGEILTRRILSDVIASSADIHALYGGVVPEIASRAHTEAISNVTYKALKDAGVTLSDISAVGVTNRPGLIGALLVGECFAKSLAVSNGIPLVAVHHIRGHIAANYLSDIANGNDPLKPPFLVMVVSGGHTSIIEVRSYTDMRTVGRTRDDAMGEAFDKIARVMGLPYPGGAMMDKLASEGDSEYLKLPSAAINDGTLDFSFSGLKTNVINHLHKLEQKNQDVPKADVAAAVTKCVVDSVIKKLSMAVETGEWKTLVLAGGVSANSHLRKAAEEFAMTHGMRFFAPPLSLCGDNGAMIAAQAYYEYMEGNTAGMDLNAYAVSEI